MTYVQLTNAAAAATLPGMGQDVQHKRGSVRRAFRPAMAKVVVVMTGAVALTGCVSVNAPDKPIVIELNVNIKQEVIYRLAQDAGNTIDKNPGIF